MPEVNTVPAGEEEARQHRTLTLILEFEHIFKSTGENRRDLAMKQQERSFCFSEENVLDNDLS